MLEAGGLGQEEYIWAMRTRAHDSVTDVKEKRSRQSPFTSQTNMERKSKTITETIDDRQTKVMASLVPDEVIYNVDDYSHRQYDGCFLFGDVSGFTELCDKYTKTGVAGPSRMTQVLNKYLGSMVQEVMSHNGDVLKFSGDAFLSIFKSSETETMRDAVHEALDCALVIQKNYGSYFTDVGIVIRVKLAISAGLVTFALIGDSMTSHYVVVGQPIWDVKAAENISSAGDIVVAPAAWRYVNTNEYLFNDMPDKKHVKIVGVGPNWRSVQKNVKQHREKVEEVISGEEDSSDSELSDITHGDGANDEFSLRPAVNVAVRLNIKEDLRRFIIAPVMKSIDMDEPFEYLTEMRQAVIVVVNVISYQLQTEETVILADRTYKTVCSVVDKMKGCVNKVSLFDKDLMFVVVFGLRGLKHELECQVALRCARECHEAINKLPGVLSTSIGVTTGKTYCGVFGHTLRREYTVISLIVNKAARLMVAYKGKVTCDRETFLHSKLEARHFILQEAKPLKGISHPGPVYEFREAETDHDQVQKINACPLLGRDDKIKLYTGLLEKCLKTREAKEQQYKMLVIKGDARQGKTRLLDELVYRTPPEIPVNRFTLNSKDKKIPYQTIQLIFYLPLFLTKESTVKEKEQKLLNVLKGIKVPELICVLNNVFGVTFKVSDLYKSLNDKEKHTALRKVIKQLAYLCFVTLWVVAIDDCKYIDDQSLDILDALFDVKTLFFVATMSHEKIETSDTVPKAMVDPRVRVDFLQPIERFYLGALVCQILDVYAISPELENAIQTRSNGNPGWIESFLISSMQDQGLYILKATLNQINDLGLVCPPLYMMARLTKEQTLKWQNIMEERRLSLDSITAQCDDWKKYIDSCRGSYLNITIREQMESISEGNTVPICVVSPNFSVSDEEMELSMDAMILKTFDSLNFYEQLLVKCSSILGNHFLRNMLLYVMSATDKRKVALAVQKLFEIKVLTCAKGDFIEDGFNFFKERLANPNDEQTVKCDCKGIKIDESCSDLPKYASCGYLQFHSSLFREITYNLLTDNQKKEFHQRAIKFLERETRKCMACGGGFFDQILGPKTDKELLNSVRSKRGKTGNNSRDFETWGNSSIRESRSSHHSLSNYSGGTRSNTSVPKQGSKSEVKSIASSILITDQAKYVRSYSAFFGISIINKLKNSFSLTRAFSNVDFSDCQCNLILSTTYAQLIVHCKGAVDLDKLINAMLEYAYLCINLSNIPLAMRILDESLDVLKLKSKEMTENLWKMSLIRAKIFSLIGYTRLELGHLNEALTNLHLSLNEYGITFPTGVNQQMMICRHSFKHFFGFYIYPRSLLKNLNHWETVFANNLAECLSHLCTLYMAKGQWKNAKMAAVWSLSKSLESFDDFRVLCVAAANMIQVAQHFRKWKLCTALEVHALRVIQLKKNSIDAEDLKCVSKLYCVIFTSRVFVASIDKAIQLGYIVMRLSSSVDARNLFLPLIPLFVYCLSLGQHFHNALSVLHELNTFSEHDTDSSGKVWYYALCCGLQIETGYTIISYSQCETFFLYEGDHWITIRDPDARRRFFTVMWLWCTRNEKWEEASNWCIKSNNFTLIKEDDSLVNKITYLYFLEGMMVYLVSKKDKRDTKEVVKIENEIQNLLELADKVIKPVRILLPRLYHLKAYFRYIKKMDSSVTELLNKAKKYASKNGNLLEEAWIEHSEKAWEQTLAAAAADFWKEHCEVDNVLDFQEIDTTGGKLGFYTLPTPIYL